MILKILYFTEKDFDNPLCVEGSKPFEMEQNLVYAIHSVATKWEDTGLTIDHGGDDLYYELDVLDPITEEIAKQMLEDFERVV